MLYTPQPAQGSLRPMESPARPQDADQALDAIQTLLASEEDIVNRIVIRNGAAPRPQGQQAQVQAQAQDLAAPAPMPQTTPGHADPEATPAPAFGPLSRLKTGLKAGLTTGLTTRLRNFQPDWRLSGALFVLAAWLFSPLILLGLAVGLVAALWALGIDRIATWLDRWHQRVETTDPGRAAHLRMVSNRAMARLERVLSWLPGRWAADMALPTFEPAPVREQSRPDPFDRLMPQDRL